MAPVSPDGKYHYFFSYTINGNEQVGYFTIATSACALATNGSIAEAAEWVARKLGVSASSVLFTSISLLAAPRE